MAKPRGGGTVNKGTVHHCPRLNKGPGKCVLVKDDEVQFCRTHCWRCDKPGHGKSVQLYFQTCPKCDRAEELPLKEAAEERAQQISNTHAKLQKSAEKK